MTYVFTRVTADDLHIMRDMLVMFGDAFHETHTYQGEPPSDAYLRALLEKPHFIALAALQDGAVVGGLAAYVLDKFERARSEVYIYDLAVAELHRRKGVATGLIRELQQVAKGLGAYVIFVQADPGDDPAIRLYEKLGTREDVHHFDIQVP